MEIQVGTLVIQLIGFLLLTGIIIGVVFLLVKIFKTGNNTGEIEKRLEAIERKLDQTIERKIDQK
ncbi:hypothetical protein EV586_10529 [Tumebacillus sp. BK434]|uniref:hypothetical protein n=1 Tax=Tumebacillus sp. BK434 TaxID=2512169 RepID=UPI0010454E63|nr:hypothetical protein [Tumebacillus sp. BK434]TCP53693.1 hypothetical protein EV586_10529 [Tumebacillus sp. BK434]